MAKADLTDSCGHAALVQARVVKSVGENKRLCPKGIAMEQGRQGGRVGLPARSQDQRGFGAFEAGNLGLDQGVGFKRAGHKARCARTRAPKSCPFLGPRYQRRMAGQAQIIIAGEIDVITSGNRHPTRVGGRNGAQMSHHSLGRQIVEAAGEQRIEPGHFPLWRPGRILGRIDFPRPGGSPFLS